MFAFSLSLLCIAVVHASSAVEIEVALLGKSASGSSCQSKLNPGNPSTMWIETIGHTGTAPFNNDGSYQVYRNVKDFGAKGDGVTDDTAAINAAISSGNRCGRGCDSTTTQPAVVYFPQGKYLVSSPIIQYYFTQLVGDAVNPPTLLASPSFKGIAVLDSNPYDNTGNNWWTNQNNFYRQVRNFIVDISQVNGPATGIHWQVAQATSLTNIVFQMSTVSGNQHQGMFMENGSGGFFSDLVFIGGKIGMWLGNQQFTARNITVSKSGTAVVFGWNWGWTFKGLSINDCSIGIDMTAGDTSTQLIGAVTVIDAIITNTPVGIVTVTTETSQPKAAGALILDNIQLNNVPNAITGKAGNVILAGTTGQLTIDSWGQGQFYYDKTIGKGAFHQGPLQKPNKSNSLLESSGKFFQRARPQYEQYSVSDFVSVKDMGAKGDGRTDDTAAIQKALQQYAGCKIIYFPAGVYPISSTIFVPAGSKLVGEAWSTLSATGNYFSDQHSPKPMLKVGNAGDVGAVEISDFLFSTIGPVPGAILVEWNIREPEGQQGTAAMWDSHFRVGGAEGTNLTPAQCLKLRPEVPDSCQGAFALLHLTPTSSAYLENVWAWTADHNLDVDYSQISIYNARGILIESQQGPVWMYGTASEHNVMYQYSVVNAKNIFMAMIQTEVPYYQSTPKAPLPFVTNEAYYDPDFSHCPAESQTCAMAWGLRVVNSQNVYIYGAGLYNFFQNYDQSCLKSEDCQDSMVDIQGNVSTFHLYMLNTKATKNMVAVENQPAAFEGDNVSTFCSTIAGWMAHNF